MSDAKLHSVTDYAVLLDAGSFGKIWFGISLCICKRVHVYWRLKTKDASGMRVIQEKDIPEETRKHIISRVFW